MQSKQNNYIDQTNEHEIFNEKKYFLKREIKIKKRLCSIKAYQLVDDEEEEEDAVEKQEEKKYRLKNEKKWYLCASYCFIG